jgi:2-phospho-L-lactate/phosphoenolpyruvate guanylyltransferase
MGVVAIVPIKALDRVKSRLAGELDAGRRRELALWMLERVVGACLRAASIDDVLVVAGDDQGAAAAAGFGARATVVTEAGLAPALAVAGRATEQAAATIVVAADLPLLAPGDIDAVCALRRTGRCVAVAPTTDGGTGALLRSPPGVIRAAFGPGSAARHIALAKARGVAVHRLERPGLAFDVDTPLGLRRIAAHDSEAIRWSALLAGPTTARGDAIRLGIDRAGVDGTYFAPTAARRSLDPAQRSAKEDRRLMPQGTVKHFDIETNTGTILLDTQEEIPFDAQEFAASGLVELRLGQRVRFELEGEGEQRQIRNLQLVSF